MILAGCITVVAFVELLIIFRLQLKLKLWKDSYRDLWNKRSRLLVHLDDINQRSETFYGDVAPSDSNWSFALRANSKLGREYKEWKE